MAKRYSAADQAKMVQDKLQNMAVKGHIQLGTFTPVHPGGAAEVIRIMEQEPSSVRDQSQEEIARGKEQLEERVKENQVARELRADNAKKGSYE